MTEASAFKPGDVVHLKSGGQTMTVVSIPAADVAIYPGGVRCMWHTTDGYVQLADFPLEALRLYATDDTMPQDASGSVMDTDRPGDPIMDAAMAEGFNERDARDFVADWRKSRGL